MPKDNNPAHEVDSFNNPLRYTKTSGGSHESDSPSQIEEDFPTLGDAGVVKNVPRKDQSDSFKKEKVTQPKPEKFKEAYGDGFDEKEEAVTQVKHE